MLGRPTAGLHCGATWGKNRPVVLGVDVGGTFTDAALLAGGRLVTAKVPSTPEDQSQGVLSAVREALSAAGAEAGDVERFVHGMTVGTNALLEGKTARCALLATEGFTDLEELGRQARPELYRLCAGHPPPLVAPELRVAVPERTGPEGVIRELDDELLARRLEGLDDAVEAAAVCLLWGFRHPEHERRAAGALGGDVHVSSSHETAGVFREYERCATTVVDAALSPLLRRYLENLAARTRDEGLPDPQVMLSSGGVAGAGLAARHASWTVLSGPAGGTVGAARAAGEADVSDAVALDMGGTSCDVSVVLGGEVAVGGGREVGGRALALPMVDVHTVGAGGGSIAWRDAGGALRVGPRSAGAEPGPACYGRGGEEPTVTDAALLLGHLDAGSPLSGDVDLDAEAARAAVSGLGESLGLDAADAAAGIARVAAVEMAGAVRVVTVKRGIDPRDLALVAFGGAGPMHAAAVAGELGMRRVIAPVSSGVLSALGLVVSERRRDVAQSVLLGGDDLTADAAAGVVGELGERGRDELGAPEAELRAAFDLRYAGQAFELTVPGELEPDPADLRAAFDRAHEEHYGYADEDAELELVTVRVAAALPGAEARGSDGGLERRGSRRARFGSDEAEAAVLGFADSGEERAEGPAVIELPGSTLVVPPDWTARAVGDAVTMELR
ncbi:MAG TPA: hydantoinase/oxoprolinase family protein [Thermoleophilaceae bacterium]|nr:hydantoinase/oxoprolinase family protein [Thermoleophilaceae bacterium]